MQAIVRIASAALVCALLGGCGGVSDVAATRLAYPANSDYPTTREAAAAPADNPGLYPGGSDDDTGPAAVDGPRMQCVPYAREHSGVDIHGNANTWWRQADGVYARSSAPVEGSVIVLTGYARNRGHVAVVRKVVSDREIRIDHANWLDHGAIYVNDPVIDVSENNDWSAVKVWNIQTGSWGTRIYAVQGFIGPSRENPLVSSNAPVRGDDAIGRQIALADRSGEDDPDDDR